jgi:hypothetical protein
VSAQSFESVLARLYTDATFRARFAMDPRTACADADLTEDERAALLRIDRNGLALAADSFARKHARRPKRFGFARLLAWAQR